MPFPSPEKQTGTVQFSDVVVTVTTQTEPIPTPPIVNKIAVFVLKGDATEDARALLIDETTDLSLYVDSSELPLIQDKFVGSLYLWNFTSAGTLEEYLQEANELAKTLVIFPADVVNYDYASFEGAIFINSADNPTAEATDNWVLQPMRGAFVDTDSQGHLIYALSRYLETYKVFPRLKDIENSSFSGIYKTVHANTLAENGYSYFFKASNTTYLDALFLGQAQARTVYEKFIVEYEIKNTASAYTFEAYNQDTLNALQVALFNTMSQLAKEKIIESVTKVFVPVFIEISADDRRQGVLKNVYVEFIYLGEIRRIYIITEGVFA